MVYDIAIVGGGIVGLATGLKLIKSKPELKIVILEKEEQLAKHQTGNNSGVIHSGLYYKPGSLKAINCINGYHELVSFCQEEKIPYEITGKVVVATREEQKPLLENLWKRGLENGLTGTRKISLDELKEYEPHCAGVAAIHVPQTGIVDYYQVALAYGRKFMQLGGSILLKHKVLKISTSNNINTIETSIKSIESKLVINCAGLYSDKIARMNNDEADDVKIIPFRGEYYKLKKEKEYLVKNLIYPVPDPNFPFLGVHFTRMMKGGVEAGPNAVLAFKREGYKKSQINFSELVETLAWPGFQKVAAKYWKTGFGELYRSFSKAAFTKALQELIPEIQESDLVDGGAGVRAQACDRSGGLLDDFAIRESATIINVLNAPSPAATSSLSIGGTVASMALKRFE
ncbi:MAG TPA: L-2-hydroxyglutarate oxidase [Algoriphagus sp.]|jgi:L-2-hydroxyglutarate oxidase|uniref:L-2-hydroxyglutarate oxidase n=2 Tax=Algoriphagus TaxID=246875 RepID=UPI000C67274E|nr:MULTISPECIES: L-2-hydroxyglutarate oxidase [unclassified Algoriphagus]MAL11979.1 L-2-hydroxyglutarate oxidase [Algoriphagus sp.]MAN87395.1 L-2-hydroxyglutarate oxidase [Algoriphagus sp.]HAH36017.1 L-2-hydroxyglutarate oxidase [Algoriphagus sp.]HCD89769.1 L-2-hydroxyglutarate oxidase [Algoriphagus sp.]HCH44153.1 L-2-hydroxyglutarate oxidase [Algoriphagus sp.]|tara:strand:- start:771 stop:1973 length:1203 start_codon:yes stop_codon:yes gene_type:complete